MLLGSLEGFELSGVQPICLITDATRAITLCKNSPKECLVCGIDVDFYQEIMDPHTTMESWWRGALTSSGIMILIDYDRFLIGSGTTFVDVYLKREKRPFWPHQEASGVGLAYRRDSAWGADNGGSCENPWFWWIGWACLFNCITTILTPSGCHKMLIKNLLPVSLYKDVKQVQHVLFGHLLFLSVYINIFLTGQTKMNGWSKFLRLLINKVPFTLCFFYRFSNSKQVW